MTHKKMISIDTAARETEISIDGKVYRLRYNFDAIAGFEEGTGVNPALQPIPPTLYNFMCLLYAGLRAHHSDVTIEVVESWFNDQTATDLCKAAWESFYGSLPAPKSGHKEDAENPPRA